MKISLAQTHILWEDKESNIDNAKKIIEDCLAVSSNVIFFPEMSFTGFTMNTDVSGEYNNYTVNRMRSIACEFEATVGFGWVENGENRAKNNYTILDANGKIISTYTKIHPFSYSGEDKRFVGGREVAVYKIDDVAFSNFICYDLRFPELFRTVARRVHAVIIPACWPAKRSEHWKALLRARAIENQVYIFAVNCQGNIGGLYYSGDSCIINPEGDVIDMLSDKEGVISFEFDDDVEEYRNSFPVLNDRKVKVYRALEKNGEIL